MAECLNHLMDFVGVDDVRIIVTHADCADRSQGFDEQEIASNLSKRLDVEDRHILLVGKDTDAPIIEDFVHRTLHKPRQFKIDSEQLEYATGLTVGARQFNTDIDQAECKLAVVGALLEQLLNMACVTRGRANVNVAIEATLSAAKHMVIATQDDVGKRSKDLTPEQRRIVDGKIQNTLIVRLGELGQTVDCLSRQRLEPTNKKKRKKPSYQYNNQKPMLTGQFVREDSSSAWSMQYRWKGGKITLRDFLARDIESESLPEGTSRPALKGFGRCVGWGKKSKQKEHGRSSVHGSDEKSETSRSKPPGNESPKARTSKLPGAPVHSGHRAQSPPTIDDGFAFGTSSWVEMPPRQGLDDVDLEAQDSWPLKNGSETEPLCNEASTTLPNGEDSSSNSQPVLSPSFRTRCPQVGTGSPPLEPTPRSPPHRGSSSWIRWCCCCTLPQSICLVVAATALLMCLRPSE